MVQYAVTQKDGHWTVFKDGQIIEREVSRSAGIELAKALAFEAENRGETVELLIQGYTGELTRKITGAG